MITFHDPEAEIAVEPVPYALNVPVRGATLDVGLLANGFPDSAAFLEHVGEALRELEPGIRVALVDKGNPTMPAGDAILKDLKDRCGAVVAAYGH